MPRVSIAGRNQPIETTCHGAEFRVGLRRTLGSVRIILLTARELPDAGTLRFVLNRPAARLRPPLIGFEVVNAGFHQRVSTSQPSVQDYSPSVRWRRVTGGARNEKVPWLP